MSSDPIVSVVLPTYRRPDLLAICLESLYKQTCRPIEVIVGRREGDEATAEVVRSYAAKSDNRFKEAVVGPDDNLVASLNAALRLSSGQLVALTDDDAEFPEDWLARMKTYFEDPTVGGAGGKDLQATNPGEATDVGRLQWFGRTIGNHHLGVGPVRDVDILKGVNCCFLGAPLREMGFDRRLRGSGNVSNWELGVCFEFARLGYRLVYDPQLVIVHHTGPRMDGDTNNRGGFNETAHANAVHNETLLISEHLKPFPRMAFLGWSVLVGTGSSPGLLQFLLTRVRGKKDIYIWPRLRCTLKGRFAGMRFRGRK